MKSDVCGMIVCVDLDLWRDVCDEGVRKMRKLMRMGMRRGEANVETKGG